MKVSINVDGRAFPPGGFDLVGVGVRDGEVVLRGAGISDASEVTDLQVVLSGEEYKRIVQAVGELRSAECAGTDRKGRAS